MELLLEGLVVNLSVYIKYGFISTLKPPKDLINKVLKVLLLLLNNYHHIDNFLASQYIAKTVVSVSPSTCMYRYMHVQVHTQIMATNTVITSILPVSIIIIRVQVFS